MKKGKKLYDWNEKCPVYESDLGWNPWMDEAVANGYDDPYEWYVGEFGCDISFVNKGRFFIIEMEDYRNHDTPWVLVECLEYNENWDGIYLSKKCDLYQHLYKKYTILGEWKTFKCFTQEANIDGVPIKDVLKESNIIEIS